MSDHRHDQWDHPGVFAERPRASTNRDFSRRAMQAGVQGYFAFLRGKRVTYLGRDGNQHTEWFPGAEPTVSK